MFATLHSNLEHIIGTMSKYPLAEAESLNTQEYGSSGLFPGMR